MARIRIGDRVLTPHPLGGHTLEGVVKLVIKRNSADSEIYRIRGHFRQPTYALISFDHSKDELVAIELLELVAIDRSPAGGKRKVTAPEITKAGRNVARENELGTHVIELGTQGIETQAGIGLKVCASLTHFPPPVNGSIAVSSIYEGALGKVEAKRVRGHIYYYLRRTGSRGQQESIYLAARWPKAIDVLARYCEVRPRDGMPF